MAKLLEDLAAAVAVETAIIDASLVRLKDLSEKIAVIVDDAPAITKLADEVRARLDAMEPRIVVPKVKTFITP